MACYQGTANTQIAIPLQAPIMPTPGATSELQSEQRLKYSSYLLALRRTFLKIVIVSWVSAVIANLALSALLGFVRDGSSFMHPYLAGFLAFLSVILLVLALVSTFISQRYFEDVVNVHK